MAKQQPITFGNTIRDVSTGLKGYAMTRTEFLNGTIQWGLQPPLAKGDNKQPDQIYIDLNQLEYIDKGIAGKFTPQNDQSGIQLGDEVEDQIQKIKGIAIRRTTFFNGCTYYSFQGPADKANPHKNVEQFIDWSRLKITKRAKFKFLAPQIPLLPTEKSVKETVLGLQTGGPSFNVPKRS